MRRGGLYTIGLTFVLAFLLFALTGCGSEGLDIDLEKELVRYGSETCSVAHQPRESLKMCGFPARVRAKALGHLLQHKEAQLQKARVDRPTDRELLHMARVMYTEAPTMRLMSYVGSVVIERKRLERFPDTVPRVVQQRWAFEGITREAQEVDTLDLSDYGEDNLKWHLSVRTAWMMLTLPEKYRPLKGVDHFWSPRSGAKPEWAKGRAPEYAVDDQFRFHSLVEGG
ncbi:cell wall hydrolase [Salinibacter ruber]|uniref:Cell wall hydrolase SleB domain-containing protein n=1 Tax=Salinibacter ruber TaxID=146919 RepID=A0AAW5P8B0_9BACT|nr:cell wall hydrolase [Salinibacter ruber]MCS4157635.1 hypothetical protein [Salinibacter ruber]